MTNFSVSYAQSQNSYHADILKLRDHLQPLRGGMVQVDLEAYDQADIVSIMLDAKNIYVLAFKTGSGTWYCFADATNTLPEWKRLRVGGTHGNLETTSPETIILPADRYKITEALHTYSDAPGTGDSVTAALRFVVVSISEAIRFYPIHDAITGLLSTDGAAPPIYKPQPDFERYMRNWEKLSHDTGHADHGAVALLHRG
ncbi:MAG: ribosome-inactivating family protein [Pseudomonadota bacterium]